MAVWQIVEDTITNYYIYVSKKGNDSTGSGTTSAPYLTINAGVTALNTYSGPKRRVLVMGSGKYINETISVSRNSARPITLLGEGIVILDGSQTSYIQLNINGDRFENLKIINYSGKYLMAQYEASTAIYIHKCLITSGQIHYTGNASNPILTITESILKNVSISTWSANNAKNCVYFNNSVFIDCVKLGSDYQLFVSKITNCIINNCGTLRFTALNDDFNYNDIIGNITWEGTSRDLAWLKENTTTNQNSISEDPLFTNITNDDYTLQENSPCSFAGYGRANIGRYGIAYTFNGLSDAFLEASGATLTNISVDENGVMFLTNSILNGEIETAMITFPKIVKIKTTHLFSDMEFDATGQDVEIIDYNTGSTEYSTHYDYLIKYGLTEAEWSSAEYKPMIFNSEISTDSSGRGNADDSFVVSENNMVVLKYLSLKIRLSVL